MSNIFYFILVVVMTPVAGAIAGETVPDFQPVEVLPPLPPEEESVNTSENSDKKDREEASKTEWSKFGEAKTDISGFNLESAGTLRGAPSTNMTGGGTVGFALRSRNPDSSIDGSQLRALAGGEGGEKFTLFSDLELKLRPQGARGMLHNTDLVLGGGARFAYGLESETLAFRGHASPFGIRSCFLDEKKHQLCLEALPVGFGGVVNSRLTSGSASAENKETLAAGALSSEAGLLYRRSKVLGTDEKPDNLDLGVKAVNYINVFSDNQMRDLLTIEAIARWHWDPNHYVWAQGNADIGFTKRAEKIEADVDAGGFLGIGFKVGSSPVAPSERKIAAEDEANAKSVK